MHYPMENFVEVDARLMSIAPMGYSLSVNVREFTQEFYHTTYPEPWVKIYHEGRYALFDPVTIWWRVSKGAVRWSEIPMKGGQAAGQLVMDTAARFDLNFGACASYESSVDSSLKSLLVAARADREFHDDEIRELETILAEIVEKIGPSLGLAPGELEALGDLALGLTHNEIADLRDVSPATVKKRVERARQRLGAKNAVQAVAMATKKGLILGDLPSELNESGSDPEQD